MVKSLAQRLLPHISARYDWATMTSSTIGDHFVLATYTSSVRGKSSKKHGPGVFATSYKKSSSSDGYVTVAVQADGVHVIDVSGGQYMQYKY